MHTLWSDFRHALHQLRNRPGSTAILIFTLALGIGATTAIFSVVYGVLLRPLPYPHPDQIFRLWELDSSGNRMNLAEPNFTDVRASTKSFAGLAEVSSEITALNGGAEPVRVNAAAVSQDFFNVMDVSPIIGRAFSAEDQREGAAPVALVSHAYWQQYLGSASDISKVKLIADKHVFSVIGVLPPHFDFPDDAAFWTPREIFPPDGTSRTAHNWVVYGRLRNNVSLAQSRAELNTLANRMKQQYGADINMSAVSIVRLQEALTTQIRPALFLLLGAVSFLLLVACANVVNLLLAQVEARHRELAVRATLGANRGTLIRQFLVESAVLCSISGAVGVLAAQWGVDVLLSLAPQELPHLDSVSANLPVLFFVLALTVVLSAAIGIFTAVRATSGDVRESLREGSHQQSAGLRAQYFGRTIVAAQLAITLVLLVGAGLLGRSLLRVLSVDPGFRTENVFTMDLAFAQIETDADKIARIGFLDNLIDRLRNLPGVTAVGGANGLPLTGGLADGTFLAIGPAQQPKRMEDFEALFHNQSLTGYADYCVASADYFSVLGVPLLRGRFFDPRDSADAPHVAVINEALARTRWPHEDPLGRTIEFGNMDGDVRLLTIVGIVGDARSRSLEVRPNPTVYVNYRQRPLQTYSFTVALRTTKPSASVIPAAQQILRGLDPNLPPRFRTFGDILQSSLAARRFNLTLVAVFAATALLLAATGIYGVMSFTVARRTRELGVRMALGATPGHVLRLVLGQGMWTTALGVLIGTAGTFALTRLISSLLFGVSPFDPLTLGGVVLLLATVSLLACWLPARKATRVDPLAALRYE